MTITTAALIKPVESGKGKLQLLSLYVDFPASAYARWATVAIGKLAGSQCEARSEMWKIDSIQTSASLWQMMTNDAANADVIIVAASSLAQPEPALFQWLDSLAALKTNRPVSGLLVGLLGDEKTKTMELDAAVKPLIRCAQQTGREFIWHWMGESRLNDSEWLAEHIENLLARKLAAASEVALQ